MRVFEAKMVYSLISLGEEVRLDKPAKVADFFPFSKSGAEDGEMTVTVGNPGGTDRQLTIAQLD